MLTWIPPGQWNTQTGFYLVLDCDTVGVSFKPSERLFRLRKIHVLAVSPKRAKPNVKLVTLLVFLVYTVQKLTSFIIRKYWKIITYKPLFLTLLGKSWLHELTFLCGRPWLEGNRGWSSEGPCVQATSQSTSGLHCLHSPQEAICNSYLFGLLCIVTGTLKT